MKVYGYKVLSMSRIDRGILVGKKLLLDMHILEHVKFILGPADIWDHSPCSDLDVCCDVHGDLRVVHSV